ncbi:MAG: helix-turn-helix domain-containing protein [Clostridiales bacterium]|nr:helix-turn-helix domain-containing protein [Clostridiales bacterium]
MLYFKSLQEAEDVLKALSTPMRLKIMEIIYGDKQMSMNDLAEALNLTNSAISMHVKKLEGAGLVNICTTSGKRGTMKIVYPKHDRLMIDLVPLKENKKCYQDDIRIGYFTSCKVTPTCGLASVKSIIGEFDDPRYFNFPERFEAGILWFGSGYIEYNIPNHLKPGQRLTELQISFEICSEYPDYKEDYPSDIYFSINGKSLGYWVSPGDFGDRKGYITPLWWPDVLNQYGLLKTLIISSEGTFIDGGSQISETTIEDLEIDYSSTITFRFEVPKDTTNCGGLTLFGEDFGDYNQAIRVKTFFAED